MKALYGFFSPSVQVIPDSAIVQDPRPVFFPQEAFPCQARVLKAWRVGRLGKDIAQRFAHRYVDAVTMAVVTLPSEQSEVPWWSTDGTLALGQWQPVEYSQEQMPQDLKDMIWRVSRFCTLKTGDILLPPEPGDYDWFQPQVGATLDLRLDPEGEVVLHYKPR